MCACKVCVTSFDISVIFDFFPQKYHITWHEIISCHLSAFSYPPLGFSFWLWRDDEVYLSIIFWLASLWSTTRFFLLSSPKTWLRGWEERTPYVYHYTILARLAWAHKYFYLCCECVQHLHIFWADKAPSRLTIDMQTHQIKHELSEEQTESKFNLRTSHLIISSGFNIKNALCCILYWVYNII